MTLRSKLALCMALTVALVWAVGGTLQVSLSFRGSLQREEQQTLQSYRTLRAALILANDISDQTTADDVADVLRQLDRQRTDWVALRLSSGRTVLYQSGSFPFDKTLLDRTDEDACALRTLKTDTGHFQQIAGCFSVEHERLYLEMARDITPLYRQRDTAMTVYRLLFAAVVLVSALISFLSAHLLTRSLRELSAVSRRIAAGERGLRAAVRGKDETAALAQDFNRMAGALTGKIDELEEAMARQERFVGSFAHELKTPMTSLIGYADLLRSCTLSPEEQRECADYIYSESRRLESLSLKLLDLLVLKNGECDRCPCDPAALLTGAARAVEEKARAAGVALHLHTESGRTALSPELVQSLLVNLLDNAVKAIDGGGQVTAAQTMLPDGCRFTVTDTGRGMSADETARVTEAFYRADTSRSRRQGGAGLGLALCDAIVRAHGGTMRFESVPGRGTTVTVELRGETA